MSLRMLPARLRSLNFLLLAGFALVALPLIFAIGLTTTYVRGLSDQSAAVVLRGVHLARDTQVLNEQLTAMERNARQYHVVGDAELLKLYQSRQTRLSAVLDDIQGMIPDASSSAGALRAAVHSIGDTLTDSSYASDDVSQVLDRFDTLREQAGTLTDTVNTHIDAALADLQNRSDRVRSALYWQAASLIPLAVLFAALFTILITRPIRRLGGAIRQLGEGDLERAIAVRGPVDIEALGGRLDWLRRRLAQLEQEKNQFLGHVSHELKTPLANIREASELLNDGSVGRLTDAQQEVGRILQENSLNLQRNIENLLNFAAWQDARERLHLGRIDLQELLHDALELHRLAMERRGIGVDAEIASLKFQGDRRKLEVMLDNLLSNALKYSPPDSTLHLRARGTGTAIRVDIADEGPGIPADEREQVFDAFYQGSRSQRKPVRGTGIGLSVVRECVRAHGGTVEIVDGKFPGAHFCIHLPLIRR